MINQALLFQDLQIQMNATVNFNNFFIGSE
jgi:hypothetical protein